MELSGHSIATKTSNFPSYTSNFLHGEAKFQELPIFQCKIHRSVKSTGIVDQKNYHLRSVIVMAKKKIIGISDELNEIASQNLDFAPARRRVRSAFTQVQQQLDHVLFQDAPAGIRTEEVTISTTFFFFYSYSSFIKLRTLIKCTKILVKWFERNSKGLQIFCKSWLPKSDYQMKGIVYFCHGYGDTCTFFFEGIASAIAGSGYGVYAVDHPGFGLSEGLHGYISSFDDIVDNVIERFNVIKERPEAKGLPRFLLGQSMGGAVAIKAHLKQPNAWDGVILVAPMCKIKDDMKPSPALLKVLTCLSNVLPKAKWVPAKDLGELMFRDPIKKKMAVYNVISYSDQMRLKTAVELLNATQDIESQVDKVSSPLLVLHGAEDKVTDPLISKFLYEKAACKDKTLKLYPEGYHCILEGEPDERILTVLKDIVSWLDSRSPLVK